MPWKSLLACLLLMSLTAMGCKNRPERASESPTAENGTTTVQPRGTQPRTQPGASATTDRQSQPAPPATTEAPPTPHEGMQEMQAPPEGNGLGEAEAEAPEDVEQRVRKEAPLLENLGDFQMEATTDVPLAKRYFDQGITLYYAFNHPEAIRSFRAAAMLDPTFAMAYWGLALAYGPNINAEMPAADVPKAYLAISRAVELAPQVSERERAFIEALQKRYDPQPMDNRAELDRAYAEAMKSVMESHRQDADAAVLYAEAMMVTMPWDYYTAGGEEDRQSTLELKPELTGAKQVLERVLRERPEHIGANHFYIHLVEAGPNPEQGLEAADRLGGLVPGAGHLVHMPAHIYLRLGRYEDAAAANERAIAVDRAYLEKYRPMNIYSMMYAPHNCHFLWFVQMMQGKSQAAIGMAHQIVERFGMSAEMMPALEMGPMMTYVRFGKWDDVFEVPKPVAGKLYQQAIWHYARTIAFARLDAIEQAKTEMAKLREIAESEAVAALETPMSYGASQIAIATRLAEAEVARAQTDTDTMLANLREAVKLQDAMPYMEPPYWYFPVRQALGMALLYAGQPADAEIVFRNDLARLPTNGWSLYGLEKALRMQNKSEEADAVKQQFEDAWQYADIDLENVWD